MYPQFKKISELQDFAELLSNEFTPPQISILKQNTKYLFNFLFTELGAKTVLIEEDYFSQSYFDDYKFFHVNSYKDFSKTCRRLHFFSVDPPDAAKGSSSLFTNESPDPEVTGFWDSYLGYIVIRPIPSGIIGATLLKYPELEDEFYTKRIPVKISNSINIFGYQFRNFKTLIYQEQDKIVGACATASLWCALDRAKDQFGTLTYSPSKLTEIAGKSFEGKIPQRRYPNKNGLTLMQITHVLEEMGLDYDIAIPNKISRTLTARHSVREFKDFIHAYIRYGIPMVLGVEFSDGELHALTLVGYKEPTDKKLMHAIATNNNIGEAEPLYRSHFIEYFYAHDDQLGPFAEIKMEAVDKIILQWDGTETVKLYSALAIIHPTWIVDLSTIKKHVSTLHNLLKELNYNNDTYSYWDYYIAPSNDWKNGIKKEGIVFNQDIIYESLPQYIWIIEYYKVSNSGKAHQSTHAFTLIVDTTSLSPLSNIIGVIIFDEEFKSFVTSKEGEIDAIAELHNEFIAKQKSIPDKLLIIRRELYLLETFFRAIIRGK